MKNYGNDCEISMNVQELKFMRKFDAETDEWDMPCSMVYGNSFTKRLCSSSDCRIATDRINVRSGSP